MLSVKSDSDIWSLEIDVVTFQGKPCKSLKIRVFTDQFPIPYGKHLESITSLPRIRDSNAHLEASSKLILHGKYLQPIYRYPHARVRHVGLRARFKLILHATSLQSISSSPNAGVCPVSLRTKFVPILLISYTFSISRRFPEKLSFQGIQLGYM